MRKTTFVRDFERGRIFVRDAVNEIIPELEGIFEVLSIRPLWIGAMAVGMIVKPVLTFDMDILLSKEDFLKLKREGNKFGIKYKGAGDFRFKGEILECIVEGERMDDYTAPPPDAIRKKGFMPSIEGLFLLKTMHLYPRDREHLARLYEFNKPDEFKLKNLTDCYGDEKLWKRYLQLKSFWEI